MNTKDMSKASEEAQAAEVSAPQLADKHPKSSASPTRRTFVFGAAALAVGAVAGTAANPFTAQGDYLRPPGHVSEAEFMARCVRCDRCISVCPTDVLYPLGIESGLGVRTPSVSFEKVSNSCIFCDKCREVCPTQALEKIDPYAPAEGRIGGAVVWPDKCITFLTPGSCGVCVDVCPYEALSFDEERRPVVDLSKCNGCGECVKICPANVLTSFSGGEVRGIQVCTERQLQEWKGLYYEGFTDAEVSASAKGGE